MRSAQNLVIVLEAGEVPPWIRTLATRADISLPEARSSSSAIVVGERKIYYLPSDSHRLEQLPPRLEGATWASVASHAGDDIDMLMRRLREGDSLTIATSRKIATDKYKRLAVAVEMAGGTVSPYAADTQIPLHTDDPAKVDRLGRAAFAEALANHVRRILDGSATSRWSAEDNGAGSMAIHLDGPWGSGKTSLLHLLAEALRSPRLQPEAPGHRPSWVVVEYNAWERESEGPSWWGLLNKIYEDSKEQLVQKHARSALALQVAEVWRRYVKGRKILWTAILAGSSAAAAAIWALVGGEKSPDSAVAAIAGGSTMVGAVYAIFNSLKKSVFAASAESAKRFADAQSDPANAIRSHFEGLYDSLKSPLAVFLDDLDRCAPEHAVELLEGIQTLFRSRPVLFVAAADRRWISKCFEMRYADFSELLPNPGHRLGDLFLEKVFQLSIRVPRISPAAHARYLDHLLHAKGDLDFEEHMRKARRLFEGAKTTEEFQEAYEKASEQHLRPDVLGQAAARRRSEAEVEERTAHALQRHAGLIQRNPRAMKRLLNYYSISRATLDIEGVTETDVSQEQLVRWLVTETRWPLLADFLRIAPDDLDRASSHFDEDQREVIADLLSDKEVRQILDDTMTADVIRHCASRLE